MSFMQSKSMLAAMLFSVAVGPAVTAAKSSPRFNGLSDGSGNFTSSPNRCAISILYDAMRIDWKDALPRKTQAVHFTLVGNAAAAGRPVTLALRGMAATQGGPRPQLELLFGPTHRAFLLPEGEFRLRAGAPLARHGDSTPVILRLTLPGPVRPGASGLASLDAVDLSLKGCQ